MKTTLTTPAGCGTSRFVLAALIILCMDASAQAQPNYTAHEWGTFTSVQGGDGELLSWRALKTSELPGFVHNWSKPGLNRFPSGIFAGKGDMVTLQRMETPVIYFYSDQDVNVDVSVGFPKGLITEWYPQASQIGPSLPAATNAASGALSESRATWKNLRIVSASGSDRSLEERLPQEESGSHYFAARATSADLVQTHCTDQNPTNEVEKFIFYRGAGSFKTPLRVTVDGDETVTVENRGVENLSRLFLVSIHDGRGAFSLLDQLAGSNSVPWLNLGSLSAANGQGLPLAQFQSEIGAQMESALVSAGLFADEAAAMVNTWKDSWFTEEGERVLYILPRAWTDATLPMTLNPKPGNLVRVMVGRAEIVAPDVEMNLFQTLTAAQNGNGDARREATAKLKQLGRFAGPALQLANQHASHTNVVTLGFELLNGAAPSKFE